MSRTGYPRESTKSRAAKRLRAVRRAVRLLAVVGLGALLAEAVAFCLTSPHLAIREVRVQGVKGDLHAWAESISAKARGNNLFLARRKRLEASIESHPAVRDASVRQTLPPALIVKVEPRKPYVAVTRGSGFYTLDRDRVPFRFSPSQPPGLSVIHAPAAGPLKLGIRWRSAYLEPALECLETGRKQGLSVARISIDPAGDMCLNIRNAVEIRAGSPQDIDKKLWVASTILASRVVPVSSMEYLDVSCPTAPAYRARGAPSDSSAGQVSQ